MKKILVCGMICAAVVAVPCVWMVQKHHNAPVIKETETSVSPEEAAPSVSNKDFILPKHVTMFDLQRIIADVKFVPEAGDRLKSQVEQTRPVLERYLMAGFDIALWVIDGIPEKDTALWSRQCLDAFPGKIIVAFNFPLGDGQLHKEEISVLLECLEGDARLAGLLVNYLACNNCESTGKSGKKLDFVEEHLKHAKSILPETPVWFTMEDNPGVAGIGEWIERLGTKTDGVCLYWQHGLKSIAEPTFNETAKRFREMGKTVIRAGFIYSAPRVRKGLEKDLAEQYNDRMVRYDEAVFVAGYKGYLRMVGSIPDDINTNLEYILQTAVR